MRIFFIEWNADYSKIMINNLSVYFDVQQVSRVQHRFKSINKSLPGKTLKKIHTKIHASIKFRKIKKDDIVICNAYSALAIINFINILPCKKILLMRDTVEKLDYNMRKKGLLSLHESYLDKITPYFDRIYTFDEHDCQRYGINFLPQFLSFTSKQYVTSKENSVIQKTNTCFYVGEYTPFRADLLSDIELNLKKYSYLSDFHLVAKENVTNYPICCKNDKLTYIQNLKKTQESDVIVEINRPEQSGLTLRALEAIFFNKKLITNNKKIIEHEFYNPKRVFIWGNDSVDSFEDFLKGSVEPVSIQIIKKYTADGMLETLKQHVT